MFYKEPQENLRLFLWTSRRPAQNEFFPIAFMKDVMLADQVMLRIKPNKKPSRDVMAFSVVLTDQISNQEIDELKILSALFKK